MDKNNTILLQDYKIKDKIYIRNIEMRRNVNKNYIVVSHQKFIAYALLNFFFFDTKVHKFHVKFTMKAHSLNFS